MSRTITASGGPEPDDVPPFLATIDALPAPDSLTAPLNGAVVNRSQDLTVTWDASGSEPPQWISIDSGWIPDIVSVYSLGCGLPAGVSTLEVPRSLLGMIAAGPASITFGRASNAATTAGRYEIRVTNSRSSASLQLMLE